MKQRLSRLLGLPKKHKLDFYECLWLGMPIALWFSYYPIIKFGQNDTMHFEISFALAYVAVLALVGLPIVWRGRKSLPSVPVVVLASAFVAFTALSVAWSPNLARGVLTAGVTGVLFLIFLSVLARKSELLKLWPATFRIFVFSAVFMSIFAIFQLFAEAWLDTSEALLLCAGCVAEQFGFARPNGFMIEPQFFGGYLALVSLAMIMYLLGHKADRWAWVALFMVTTALVLTLSRGAIFSFIVGYIVLIIVYRHVLSRVMATVWVALASVVVALSLQGFASATNPAVSESFFGAISKSINQLSMGLIEFSPEKTAPTQSNNLDAISSPNDKVTPVYDGYVVESTNTRVKLTVLAINTWSSQVSRIFFGVGLGGAGVSMYDKYPSKVNAREIVQNEYVEVLLERGLIGLSIFLLLLAGLFYGSGKDKQLWAIIVAVMVQWLFFSGYPNALHAYLSLIVVGALLATWRLGQTEHL